MRAKVLISTSGSGLSRAVLDEANSWTVSEVLQGEDMRCLATDPTDSSKVYAGRQEGGVLASSDRGLSWEAIGLDGITVKSLVVSKTDPDYIIAGTKSPPSLYRSLDGGGSWEEIEGFRKARSWYWFSPAEPPFTPYVQSVGISPTDPKVLAAGIEFGAVVMSEDGGVTWSGHLDGSLRDCHTMVFHSSNGSWVYEAGGTGGGAAFSRDGGRTWTKKNDGLDRPYGWACAGDGVDPETWYVSAAPQSKFPSFAPPAHIDGQASASIYRTRGGGSWERLTGGLPDPLNYMAYALRSDPEQTGHLYAGLSSGEVWFTADFGDSWEQLPLKLAGIHRDMVVLF